MSCTHKEPRPILDYLNIKALNYISGQHDTTRNHKQIALVLMKTLGEHNLLEMNIDSSLIPKSLHLVFPDNNFHLLILVRDKLTNNKKY